MNLTVRWSGSLGFNTLWDSAKFMDCPIEKCVSIRMSSWFTRKKPLSSYAPVSSVNANTFSGVNPSKANEKLTALFNELFEAERKHSTSRLTKLIPRLQELVRRPNASQIINTYFNRSRTPSDLSRISDSDLADLKRYVWTAKNGNSVGGKRRTRRNRRNRKTRRVRGGAGCMLGL